MKAILNRVETTAADTHQPVLSYTCFNCGNRSIKQKDNYCSKCGEIIDLLLNKEVIK